MEEPTSGARALQVALARPRAQTLRRRRPPRILRRCGPARLPVPHPRKATTAPVSIRERTARVACIASDESRPHRQTKHRGAAVAADDQKFQRTDLPEPGIETRFDKAPSPCPETANPDR